MVHVGRVGGAVETAVEVAVAVVEVELGQGAGQVEGVGRGGAGAVAAEVVLESGMATGEERADRFDLVRVVQADRHDDQPTVGQPLGQLDRVGESLDARRAPGGPIVDEDHLPPMPGQHLGEPGPIDQRHRDRPRRVGRLALWRRVRRVAARQQEGQCDDDPAAT